MHDYIVRRYIDAARTTTALRDLRSVLHDLESRDAQIVTSLGR